MKAIQTFQILLKRPIPYISKGLMTVMIIGVVLGALLWLFMLPTKDASLEMSTAYYITIVPKWVKEISGLGLFIAFSCYLFLLISPKKNATLFFDENTIRLAGKGFEYYIGKKEITQICVNDIHDAKGFPKDKMQIVIKQRYTQSNSFHLADYNDAESIVDEFAKIPNIEFLVGEHEYPTSLESD